MYYGHKSKLLNNEYKGCYNRLMNMEYYVSSYTNTYLSISEKEIDICNEQKYSENIMLRLS